jgi:hypothetical protein
LIWRVIKIAFYIRQKKEAKAQRSNAVDDGGINQAQTRKRTLFHKS